MMAKVCGMTTEQDVALSLAAGADLVGFLHCPSSPRHCPGPALATAAGDRAILVAVAPDVEALEGLLCAWRTPWVQPYLPADQRAEGIRLLRSEGRRVLLPWPDEPDQALLEADLYLWETSPKATGLLGGSGQGHPMAHRPPGPFLLGGGLRGDVLGQRLGSMPAGARALCMGFDAASRLEAAPGRKDPGLVAAFVETAHGLGRVGEDQI